MALGKKRGVISVEVQEMAGDVMWRNNGNATFTNVTQDIGLLAGPSITAVGTDYNNDRAVDIAIAGSPNVPTIFENPREGKFSARQLWSSTIPASTVGLAVLDFNHDGWMDIIFTHSGPPGITLWQKPPG